MSSHAQATWSPLFKEPVSSDFRDFHECLDQDKRIALYDVMGSKVHAQMLARASILTDEENRAIQNGLDRIAGEMRDGTFVWKKEYEDVHMNVEQRLTALIGDAGKKLHTARSRNDQNSTDVKLYARAELDQLMVELHNLIRAFTDLAEQHVDTIMPGFTHLQVAQPITFGHHLMAYSEMFLRDLSRVKDARERLNRSPLGMAALAGTSFPIDPEFSAHQLGFSDACHNSLDAVSDRDYIVEIASAASLIMVHLSRFCEEVIMWCTPLFNFIEVGDAFCTGSSIMPQKRNPDLAELVRGKTSRVLGNLTFSATLSKNLPLAFNKDLQECKPPLTDTLETVRPSVSIVAQMIASITVNKSAMRDAAEQGYSTATDLADYLVRKGVPFRDAHHVVAAIVRIARERGIDKLSDMDLSVLQSESDAIQDDVFEVLTVEGSVASRAHTGGTAPNQVKREIERVRSLI
ncbi:argininosuccinate lyase [Brucella pituitosa]|uniref:argininosuccinate lyase n=1 Tax=Brucella pituitosa TaxID=571256 RepID=UPI000F5E11F8|nr:argininosuccinate lyase [Brucellaceae bacterium VT-16-1752]